MDLNQLQAKLAGKRGPEYWKSLEQLADSAEFTAFLDDEFPRLGGLWNQPIDRRGFLKFSAAALAMAGLTACTRQPPEQIVPYVKLPERVTMGAPLRYATTLSTAGPGVGVLVETYEGRPLHIGGNPQHPASPVGGADVFSQAALLELYDPDRGNEVSAFGRPSDYAAFETAWSDKRRKLQEQQGKGLYILSGEMHSPSLVNELRELQSRFPAASWHGFSPVERHGARAGARIAFGEPVETDYRLSEADVVLSLDADIFGCMAGHFRYAHDFMDKRRFLEGAHESNRLYAVESLTTITGAKADHRKGVRPSEVETVARHLARRLGHDVPVAAAHPLPDYWFDALVRDLEAHRGRCVVIPGDEQPAAVHALAHAINDALENSGRTVTHRQPALPDAPKDLPELVEAMRAGEVDTLLIVGGNPAYDAPVDLDFAKAMSKVPLRIYYGLYRNETGWLSHWYVPMAHELESWGDLVAYDGMPSIVQPVVRPIYGGVEPLVFLPGLYDEVSLAPLERLRRFWRRLDNSDDFDRHWQRWLHDGVVSGIQPREKHADLRPDWTTQLPPPAEAAGLELRFAPDPAVWDGRLANSAWLQELPKPLSKIAWGNALHLSPQLAAELGVKSDDVVEVQVRGQTLEVPVFVQIGQPAKTVTLHLGYGRSRAGRVGDGVGADAYKLRHHRQWFAPVTLRPAGRREAVVTTQHHHHVGERNIVHTFTLDEVRHGAKPEDKTPHESLYPQFRYDGYRWGMAIDLTACIGCNACLIACQMENNQPTVGKNEVQRGHEMHWLRIDRYYKGPVDEPEVVFQPVPCMHCEKAPCEYVCPVHATTHSSEGINQMNYQRCIGTRDCSQNCPYKVRRFNWFDYTGKQATTPAAKFTHNPEVTVRSRGVMEKCTYCIQRIDRSRIEAQIENRRIRDGELKTACQEACPTRAIVFGDLNDPAAEVNAFKASPLNYAMLAELNTRPRTSYLAGVRNKAQPIEQRERSHAHEKEKRGEKYRKKVEKKLQR